MYTMRFLATKT